VGSGASLVEYTWVWNDGTENTVGASAQASHAFATAGVYTVRVIVRDNLGRTASATATVTVV
jgi:PKD repeat protein